MQSLCQANGTSQYGSSMVVSMNMTDTVHLRFGEGYLSDLAKITNFKRSS